MEYFNLNLINNIDNEKVNKKYTLLLVDDEEANLRMLEGLLENDYNIITALDGKKAYEMVQKDPDPNRISLVITDQRMPGMTGVEFLKETLDILPNTIRMILTGF